MTVINGIEIDNIDYKINDIKFAIQNNDPIEDKLHVILVVSNPCLYATRYILFREFVKRFEEEEHNVIVYIVELCYGDQKFLMTDSKNKRHLQIRTETPIWHKENMINLGVKLLPPNYKAFAWIDADIEFDSESWALDTLKILNGSKDVIQLFSHCVDMDYDKTTLQYFNGFGYSFSKQKKYTLKGLDYWHPGYAWAITRKAYERIGGLYDKGILGSGDHVMAMSFINKVSHFFNSAYSDSYNKSMLDYQRGCHGLRLGYTPGLIRHYYHGSKKNRQYTDRCKILIKNAYSIDQLVYKNGLLVANISKEFKDDIMKYFQERKEDEQN